MALKLGNSDAEKIDIVFQTKVDLEGTEQLIKSIDSINKLVSKAAKSTQTAEKQILKEAEKQTKSILNAKQKELAIIKQLSKAYMDYRRDLATGNKALIGLSRNQFVDAVAAFTKLKNGAAEAAQSMVNIFRAADKQIALDTKANAKLRQKILDHYYDKAVAKQKQLKKAEKDRDEYRLKQIQLFEKEKERFQEKENRRRQQQFAANLKKEMLARQKASQAYFAAKRKEMQFDLKAHNHRLAYIEAEANKQKVLRKQLFGMITTPKKMAWGRTPEEASRMMRAQQSLDPSHKQYVGEFQKIHSTDLRSFKHKMYTTSQYATASLIYYGVIRGAQEATKAIIDFNKYTSQMAAVFRISSKEAGTLGEKLQTLGTTLGGNQEEIYKIALALGRAGIATKDLAKASEVVIRMAYLTGDSFNDATNAIITYTEVFGEGTGRGIGYSIQELGDKLAYVANVSRLSTQDIGIFSNYALGAARAAGLTVDAVGAMAAAFSNAGMNASTIGTQIRRFTTLLSDQTTSITRFFKTIGVSQGILRKELQASLDGTQMGIDRSNEAIKRFAARLAALTDNEFAQFTAGMDLLARNSLTFLRQEAGAFATYLDGSLNKATGLLAESDKMLNSYIISWEKLVNTIKKGFAELGDSYIVARFFRGIADASDALSSIFSEERKQFEKFGYGKEYDEFIDMQSKLRELAEQAKFGDSATEKAVASVQLDAAQKKLKALKESIELRRKEIAEQQRQKDISARLALIYKTIFELSHTQLTDKERADKLDMLAMLGKQINDLKLVNKELEQSAKLNKESLQIQEKFKEITSAYTRELAQSAYLENIKMESWATMVSQLSKSLPQALSVFNNMLNYAEQKIDRIKTQAEAAVTTTAGLVEIDETSPLFSKMTQASQLVGNVKDLQTASVSMAELSRLQVEAQKELSEKRKAGVKETNKEVQNLEKAVEFYKDMIAYVGALQQVLTQTRKAENAVWGKTDSTLENIKQKYFTIMNANSTLSAKINKEATVDSTLLNAKDALIDLDQLILKLRLQAEANRSNKKILEEIEARLQNAVILQQELNKATDNRSKLLRQWEKIQAEDKTADLLTKAENRLKNIRYQIIGRNSEQEKFVDLLVEENRLRRKGFNDLADKLKTKRQELLMADKMLTILKQISKYDKIAALEPKYAAATDVYESQLTMLNEQYQKAEIAHSEYVQRKKRYDEDYTAAIIILNDQALAIYKKQLDKQAEFAKRLTEAMKGSFEDFFDYTSDGFMDLGKLAEQVLHDIYMQIVRQSITNPLSKGLGNVLQVILPGELNENAHGNVFQKLTKYATGGVVTKPTFFPMANGTGLMGEAGPEAILPLTRINGDLGVKAVGGPVVINVENTTGIPIDFKQVGEQMQDDGSRIIDVVIEHAQTNPEFRQIMGINS